jgi:hypothetical protein
MSASQTTQAALISIDVFLVVISTVLACFQYSQICSVTTNILQMLQYQYQYEQNEILIKSPKFNLMVLS